MFTVDKSELSTYWWACAGVVEERLGEYVEDKFYFKTLLQADQFARREAVKRNNEAYTNLLSRAGKAKLFVYKIRAIWDRGIKNALARYDESLEKAKELALSSPTVKVKYLPNQIPVLGQRIAIGANVYEVDTFSLQVEATVVTEENIYYYDFRPEGVTANYRLSNGRCMASDLRSKFSNIEFYLDKDQAYARLKGLVNARMQELQKLLD